MWDSALNSGGLTGPLKARGGPGGRTSWLEETESSNSSGKRFWGLQSQGLTPFMLGLEDTLSLQGGHTGDEVSLWDACGGLWRPGEEAYSLQVGADLRAREFSSPWS